MNKMFYVGVNKILVTAVLKPYLNALISSGRVETLDYKLHWYGNQFYKNTFSFSKSKTMGTFIEFYFVV